MSLPFSTQTAVLVGVLTVILPITYRIVSSPLTLLLVSPFILFFLGISFLALHIFLGHILDARKPIPHNNVAHAAKTLSFSSPAAWQAVLTRSQWSQNTPQSLPPLVPDSPLVSSAVNEILIMIVRDFVLTWYKEISSSPAFPVAVSSVLHDSLATLLDRAAGIDLPALLVKRILPKVTEHIDLFRQSEVALRGAGLERRLTQSEELDMLLASKYASGRDNGKLHPAIENLSTSFTRQTEELHLRNLIDKALPFILPEKERQSKALKIVVREIVACAVLYPVMEMVSDPDTWNKAIDQVAGEAIHQQKLITKVRNVLEAQSPRSNRLSTALSSNASGTTETITIRTDMRQFESFLRSISRCSSLLDARRLKNDVSGEIRRTRMLLANHEKDDWINGERTEDVVAFLDRLYKAKRMVEERIVELGGEQSSITSKTGITLRDVLRDPSSLSYFMEYMDRRNRSLLVQFWLTVETFKNPLESVDSDTDDDEDETIQNSQTAVTVKEDISMIHDLYFSGSTPHPVLSSISPKYVDSIRHFVRTGMDSSPVEQRRVRKSVLLAQRQVERKMEQDFEEFGNSELWFRVIEDGDFQGRKEPSPMIPTTHTPSTIPASAKLHSLPRSESAPGLTRRTPSSGSGQSSKSALVPTQVHRAPPTNIEVLMSPVLDGPSDVPERAPLFDDPDDRAQRAEERRMEAISAALTDIIALDDGPSKASDDRLSTFLSPRTSTERRERSDSNSGEDDDETEDVNGENEEGRSSFQLAGPGDLQLTYEIARLADKIVNLEAQETMLNNLIKKAELTGDTQELRLLNRSKSSMNRDLRELRFQKLQYEQQESANRLVSDRTRVSIVSSTTAEEAGKSVVRYLVEVQQLAPDGTFASGWVVARRYNEFFNMHNKLREKYGLVRNLEFPGKRLVTALSGNFVDTRRAALEKYLQNLIAISIVCESNELRGFLSRESPFVVREESSTALKSPAAFSGSDLVRNVYRSVTESIDDMFFGPSMLDVMIQRLTRQAAEFAGIVGSGVNDEDLVAQALHASGKTVPEAALMQLSADLKPLEGESSTSSFTAPICDLLLAIFELNKRNNWLRRQAIVIILQQVLGGTIERKIRETAKTTLDESRLIMFIKLFRDGLWPGGKLKPPGVPRTSEEKSKTRDEANRKLSSLVPELAANMIGRSNARRGARRIFAVLQNRRLNQHIVYTIVDEVFSALFPESQSTSASSTLNTTTS
ncbi:tRNA (guanine-N(7)-)-methyltransferase (tRNA(m7G46)-methyltransferase) [Marasmius crinis-equi]|uniref:tRNA (Guanine-N(7)-)-methyltransferase (tRNA(m7G46)-methyltransferase) n=1 Tax=Marasmius crinis-equi TaxID=585013 RepID=A0ABR3FZR7_9AGAR